MLWAEGGLTGRLALLVTAAGFVLNGDFFWIIVLGLISHLYLPATELTRHVVIAVQVFPAPLILLVMSVFYMWVYVSRSFAPVVSAESGRPGETQIAPALRGSGTYLKRPTSGMIPSSPNLPDRKRDRV